MDDGSQTFEGGYIFFSDATGVHEVHGLIGRRYWETGDPEGSGTYHTDLGFPTSDEIGGLPACHASGCGLGAKSIFQAGSIQQVVPEPPPLSRVSSTCGPKRSVASHYQG